MEKKLDLHDLIKDIESKVASCHKNMVSLNDHIDKNGLQTQGQILNNKENKQNDESVDNDDSKGDEKIDLKIRELQKKSIKNFITKTFEELKRNSDKYNLLKIDISFNHGDASISIGGRYASTKIDISTDNKRICYKNGKIDLKSHDKDIYEYALTNFVELNSIINSFKNNQILNVDKNLLALFKGSNIERKSKIKILNKNNKIKYDEQ